MTIIHKWVPGQPRPLAKTYRNRPQITNLGQTAIRVEFRFETVWVIQDPNGALVGGDGHRVTTAKLPDGRALIGYETLEYQTSDPLNISWRNILLERLEWRFCATRLQAAAGRDEVER